MMSFQFLRVIGVYGGVVSAGVLGCSSDEESTTSNPLEPGGVAVDTSADDGAVCQSSLFCDGFEAFAAGTPPSGAWTANQNNGTVARGAGRESTRVRALARWLAG